MLGLGVSHAPLVEGNIGGSYQKPLATPAFARGRRPAPGRSAALGGLAVPGLGAGLVAMMAIGGLAVLLLFMTVRVVPGPVLRGRLAVVAPGRVRAVRMVRLPGGHFTPLDCPAPVAHALRSFLTGLSSDP